MIVSSSFRSLGGPPSSGGGYFYVRTKIFVTSLIDTHHRRASRWGGHPTTRTRIEPKNHHHCAKIFFCNSFVLHVFQGSRPRTQALCSATNDTQKVAYNEFTFEGRDTRVTFSTHKTRIGEHHRLFSITQHGARRQLCDGGAPEATQCPGRADFSMSKK